MLGTPLAQVPEDLQSVRRVGTVALRPENAHLADVGAERIRRAAIFEEIGPQVFEQDWIAYFYAHASNIGSARVEGLGNPP